MNRVLIEGARQQADSHDFEGWNSMDTAPRDGTWVEIKNTYGVAPWYCVARWTREDFARCSDGTRKKFEMPDPAWVTPDGGGPCSEGSLHWRPYAGEVSAYIDPTGGMQNQMAYWRGAVAQQYGLPLDHFEAEVSRRAAGSLWQRFLRFVSHV